MEKQESIKKDKIFELVESFQKASKNKEFINEQNEEWVKWNYLEPLFDALGWNRSDIVKEQRILKGRADYVLKIGNEEVLVIEAKKVGANLTEDEGRQAVSYAYHRKIKFAVLTNFKEVRVYHALSNIKNIDNNLLKFEDGSIFRLNFEQFIEKIDKLILLSKDSIEKQEIHKLLSRKDEKTAKPIDESILHDLLQIRELLSKDLKKLRMQLSQLQIDEAVQVLINRLIFMRSVEDRGLENKNFLLGLIKEFNEGRLRKRLWDEILVNFKNFDTTYNSKLFAHSILEDENIFFDDSTLTKTIRILYFGSQDIQARYMFDEIPGDLLGSIYEQYLGTVLRETEKRVTLDKESGKRKKMGIYYTPSYIVDYIIKNTVGEYIKDKTIDEILDVNIVDPACGSGSFLLRAFQEVCNQIEERLKKGERAKTSTFTFYNENRLSLSQKVTILTNCIYGVDLDEKAIELAQLNLLLRILEDETPSAHKHLLPNLRENIKCGNSLIDDPKVAGDKAFNWNAQFPDVFRNGGFDVVVGNPPYGVNFINSEKNHLKAKYPNSDIEVESYILFVEKTISHLIKENGYNGFIIPNNILTNIRYQNIRKLIINSSFIDYIVDLGSDVFGEASVDSCIIIIKKNKCKNDSIKTISIDKKDKNLTSQNYKIINQKVFEETSSNIFNIFSSSQDNYLINKIENNSQPLGKFTNISRGIEFGYSSDLVYEKRKGGYASLIAGRCINRYSIKFENKYVMFNEKDKKIYKDRTIYELEKILVRRIGHKIIGTYDNEKYYNVCDVYNIQSKENINLKLILAVINSKLMVLYILNKFKSVKQLFPKIPISNLQKIPIKLPNHQQETHIISLVDQMLSLQKKLHEGRPQGNEKERIEQQIKNIDYEIDQEVYKLYDLTKEEIKIVEESLK